MKDLLDPPESHFQRMRMVATQLESRGVRDPRVLAAMAVMPREYFVPDDLRESAYGDGPLPIGSRQTISQPYMVAVMAEYLLLKGHETVLEVGAGSGYGAAILSQLAHRVIAIERIPELLETARSRWRNLGLDNIEGVLGDGSEGYPQGAPFGGISVTAGAPGIPHSLLQQLDGEDSRLVIPVGGPGWQHLCVVRRGGDGSARVERRFPCAFVPLVGKEGWS